MDLERRFLRGELRAQGEGKDRRILGYAAVFNSLSEDLGGWKEMIEPGAFKNSILKDDVRGLYNHDVNLVLGRTKAGTLVLVEDEIGLRYEIIPPETSYAGDLLVSIDRGDVDQSSFGFRTIEEAWRHPTEEQPFPIRLLREVKLYDVSPVTFPAYPVTSVTVRDMVKQMIIRQATDEAAVGGPPATPSTPSGCPGDGCPGDQPSPSAGEGAQGPAGRLALRRRRLQLIEKY